MVEILCDKFNNLLGERAQVVEDPVLLILLILRVRAVARIKDLVELRPAIRR